MRNGTFKKNVFLLSKNTPTITTTHRLKKSRIEITKKINEKKLVYMENTICLLVEQNTIEFFKKL